MWLGKQVGATVDQQVLDREWDGKQVGIVCELLFHPTCLTAPFLRSGYMGPSRTLGC